MPLQVSGVVRCNGAIISEKDGLAFVEQSSVKR